MNDEIESERQDALDELLKTEENTDINELAPRYAPGTFGCHEALHTTSVALDLFTGHVMNHPSVVLNSEWYRLAAEAREAISQLYQAIGAEHLKEQ